MSFQGQWIGTYKGSAEGYIILNIDDVGGHYEGNASVLPTSSRIPSSTLEFTTPSKDATQVFIVRPEAVHPRQLKPVSWEKIKSLYPADVQHPDSATVRLQFRDGLIHLRAEVETGDFSSILRKSEAGRDSQLTGERLSWSAFKNRMSCINKTDYLFRGQSRPWMLCTSFHRSGRFRLSEFINNDVNQLHRKLSSLTEHFFDLSSPEQNGSFYSLLQHHGYPTPLLDWSYSPYVAAFFAFRDVRKPISEKTDDVRIFLFDNRQWSDSFTQSPLLNPPIPHLSVMEFISIANPRQLPQQAATTATNMLDIEAYIKGIEETRKTRLLTAIDIPASERDAAMEDLRFMGITAATMFPGIDGVCEALKESNFEF